VARRFRRARLDPQLILAAVELDAAAENHGREVDDDLIKQARPRRTAD
jgi:hypothetical protein